MTCARLNQRRCARHQGRASRHDIIDHQNPQAGQAVGSNVKYAINGLPARRRVPPDLRRSIPCSQQHALVCCVEMRGDDLRQQG